MSQHELVDVPNVLTAEQLRQTVDSIAAAQQESGSIPWPDGHTDAWDHVECAMALTLGGRLDDARKAYDWLRATQLENGAWAMSYDQFDILDSSVDANQCAYIAVGVWQWWTLTRDFELVTQLWPHVARALDFVIDLQLPTGHMSWGRAPSGDPSEGSLLTGCASTYQALRCGLALAELAGEAKPEWELSAGALGHAVAAHPEGFLDKSEFSMDWYYPVLGGAVRGPAAEELINRRWNDFVMPGMGARCVSDRPWITAAETCELALSLIVIDQPERARQLLTDVQFMRRDDGSYWTGWVYDNNTHWPAEASTWTAAAVVLACDALAGGPTFELFAGHSLPPIAQLPTQACRSGADLRRGGLYLCEQSH
jgi:hypothetical protein